MPTDQTTTPTVSEAQKLATVVETMARNPYQHLFTEREFDLLLNALRAMPEAQGWRPIESAPKDAVIDIWVSGPGARRIANCRWEKPSQANWGDRYGCDQDLPAQWITVDGFALDRRNGVASHWMPLPAPPPQEVK